MTLTPYESAFLSGPGNMDPHPRVNSLSSLALAVLDSSVNQDDNINSPVLMANAAMAGTSNVTDSSTGSLRGGNLSSANTSNDNTSSSIEQSLPQISSGSRSPIKSPLQVASLTSINDRPAPASGTRLRGSSLAGPSSTIRRKSRELIPGPIRRASQVLISLTSLGDGASLHGECSRRDSRIVPQITLLYSSLQRLPMKDFGAEVRASMDVDQFLQQAVLLLDVPDSSLEGIVEKMLRKVKKF